MWIQTEVDQFYVASTAVNRLIDWQIFPAMLLTMIDTYEVSLREILADDQHHRWIEGNEDFMII